MNPIENDIELIERYFDQVLTPQETVVFEKRLTTDNAFRALVENEKYLIGAIRLQGLTDELHALKRLELNMGAPQPLTVSETSSPPSQRNIRKWYLMAAAIAGLLITGRFVFYPSPTPADLYEDYFRPYPNVFSPNVRGTETSPDRAAAFEAYERGDYTKAAGLFRQLLAVREEPGILMLLGNCELVTGNTDEAIRLFSSLDTPNGELALQARWFLSLAYIKNGNQQQAVPLLQGLAATESSYADKARDILDNLD